MCFLPFLLIASRNAFGEEIFTYARTKALPKEASLETDKVAEPFSRIDMATTGRQCLLRKLRR
jgi:hypothetical protein